MWESALKLLARYQAVVFDLDGTLVVLKIDWTRAQQEMMDVAATKLGRDFKGRTVWEMLRLTKGQNRHILERTLRRLEVEGAQRAERLPLSDMLPNLKGRKVGLVTMNSRSSCITALEKWGLASLVNAIVAREDSKRLKPDPEPLLQCLRMLEAEPGTSVFIGDRERDRLTARRAGTAFIRAADLVG